jgi:hypothetical protein
MTGKSLDDTAALREELWDAYLYKFMPRRPTSDAERHSDVLDRLAELRKKAAEGPDNIFAQYEIFQSAIVLVHLLVAEISAPFLELKIGSPFLQPIRDLPGVPLAETADRIAKRPSDDPDGARLLLLGLLDQQLHACPPTHRHALDSAVAIVPRKLLGACYDALKALDLGETLPFVAPVPAGRAKHVWSRTVMCLRALEHVEFLRGKGLQKKAAYFEVGKALGGVSDETVRWWIADIRPLVLDLDTRLETARRAGELATKLQHHRAFGSQPGETIDAAAQACMRMLRDEEPLASFGKCYRRERDKP